MNYRYATVLAEKDLQGAGTEVIDLNVQDPISRLEIGYRVTLADNAMLAALVSPITKVELIDGSDVLHSLSGVQNQALCLYDRRVPTMNHGDLGNGSDSYATMGIDFGRYLYDPELAFDPKKFRNPQIKITHDRALVGASTSTHKLEIFAHLFDEKAISPIGFLMAKEHWTWTPSGNNVYAYADLPLDYPIRQILLRAFLTQVQPDAVVDYFKLSEDNDKRIPIDCELQAYIRRMKGQWTVLQEGVKEYTNPPAQSPYTKYFTPTDDCTAWVGMPLSDETPTVTLMWIGDHIKGGYVYRRGQAYNVGFVTGYLPHHCIQFPFGRQDQLDDWYDVTRLGSLRARMMSAASCSTTSVVSLVLQQLRRY